MKRDYRATYTVLRVDPAFLALSPLAKLYWHTAKLELPVHGIGICLAHTIAGLAGMAVDQAIAAEAECIAANWMKRDGAVLWIVNGLRHTPNLSSKDAKHRDYVRRLLTDLPRDTALLGEFRAHYAEWFTEGASEGPSEPLPEEHGSTIGSKKKKEGRSKKDSPSPSSPAATIDALGTELYESLLAHVGSSTPNDPDLTQRTFRDECEHVLAGRGVSPKHVTADQLRAAVSEFVANDALPKLSLFRGYLRNATKAPRSPPSNGNGTHAGQAIGAGGKTYLNARRALGISDDD